MLHNIADIHEAVATLVHQGKKPYIVVFYQYMENYGEDTPHWKCKSGHNYVQAIDPAKMHDAFGGRYEVQNAVAQALYEMYHNDSSLRFPLGFEVTDDPEKIEDD